MPASLPAITPFFRSVRSVRPLSSVFRPLSLSLCLALAFVPLKSNALTEGDYTYTTNAAGQATITDFNSAYAGALSITNTLGGCPVTAIGAYAFEACSELSSVTLPGSVTAIGEGAFYKCYSLTSATLPGSVTAIGERAFYGCEHLTSVTIPAGVTSINAYTFYFCPALSSVTLPASVTSIGDYAFCDCEGLPSITIPAGVTSIGYAAFCDCAGLPSVTIPGSVTSIGDYAFDGCASLTSVTIPVGVPSIGYATFANCDRLTSVTLPDSVTSIGEYAFCDCKVLPSITIPGSVTNIGECAFSFCTGLTGVLFQGNPPALSGSFIFYSIPASLCLYYLPAFASSWPSTFAGRPTSCWNPTVQRDVAFGFAAGRFSFNVSGTPDIPVKVEATTNLATRIWTPVTNAKLDASGSLYFTDPAASTLFARFYRIVFP